MFITRGKTASDLFQDAVFCLLWDAQGWVAPTVDEQYNPDRTILTLLFAAKQAETSKDQSKTPNRHDVGMDVGLKDGLADRIMGAILDNPSATTAEIAEMLSVTSRTVEREIKKLREADRIVRVGGKRYGHWEINE